MRMKRTLGLGGALLIAFALVGVYGHVHAQEVQQRRLITVFDRGQQVSFLSGAKTLGEALSEASITLDPRDTVEPSRDEELVASEYKVNIFRARPVVVIDGPTRTKVMTPYQTSERIAKDAGIVVYAEDIAVVDRSSEFIGDGAGLTLTINRAVVFTLDLYGKKSEMRTHGTTVQKMLEEKNIRLGANDFVSVPLQTGMTNGMTVRVWREGIQTITEDQPTGFASEIVYDADRPVGYRALSSQGEAGIQSVTYEIDVKAGVEVSRKEIARITTKEPVKQSLVIGIQGLEKGLTRSRGALFHTDSKGVVHRETYYDLEMGRVMRSCGQGGKYTVRFDGMKIDSEGYIIIAANYARYPKCSIVETSAGPGRVYDTGGFVLHHPDGFDLATDWSNSNGR